MTHAPGPFRRISIRRNYNSVKNCCLPEEAFLKKNKLLEAFWSICRQTLLDNAQHNYINNFQVPFHHLDLHAHLEAQKTPSGNHKNSTNKDQTLEEILDIDKLFAH